MYSPHPLVAHVENSLENAFRNKSKVTADVLALEGMSGRMTRHFYNNICSLPDARYLEVGTWKGSTLCSAMCGNQMRAVAIDNWSEFNGPRDEFMANFNRFKGDNDVTVIEKNCFEVDPTTMGPGSFNIYMYDGQHEEESHFQALNHFTSVLTDDFIYIIDDWNWRCVRDGTMRSIERNNLEILYMNTVRTSWNEVQPPDHIAFHNGDWHNGMAVFVLRKRK